jgi:hypothetical protein
MMRRVGLRMTTELDQRHGMFDGLGPLASLNGSWPHHPRHCEGVEPLPCADRCHGVSAREDQLVKPDSHSPRPSSQLG